MASNWLLALAWELAMFAAVLGLVMSLDDLIVDILWMCGIGSRPKPLSEQASRPKRRYAVLIPAWQEAAVIGPMLATLREQWGDGNYRVYVGAYPNDIATLAVLQPLANRSAWLDLTVLDRPGPTTKGDCLNALWHRLREERSASIWVPDAIIVHDAENVVSREELAAHDCALIQADYSQLPVVPLINPAGPWWSGHYLDEFAEAHTKELVVRQAIGAMIPTAGVGFAVKVTMLERLAGAEGPFAGGSLTEDYELGIRLARAGAVGRILLLTGTDGQLIATRAYFPHHFDTAVRQKTRWMQGIALAGWDRLGWAVPGGSSAITAMLSRWMLWRDRRTLLCALALLAGYAALVITLAATLLAPDAAATGVPDSALVRLIALVMTFALLWRLAMRACMTARLHGWRQGLLAIPRQVLSNMVMIACGWRALLGYGRVLRGGPVRWAKTDHHFPPIPKQSQ